jgi:hypothetical protein
MFVVQWADPDLGDASDDFVGCDTSRSLCYVYNGRATDAMYGTSIPAVGFDIVQGPVVPGAPGDTAAFHLSKRPGYRNLPLSAIDFFIGGSPAFIDPAQGPGGDIQWYRLMNATIAATGNPFIDPVTGKPTKFCLSGDPTAHDITGGHGWVDGMGGLSPSDRRMCLVAGPFTLAAGDTQEMVVALTAGLGADYLSSISVLRSNDDKVQNAYNAQTGVGPLVGISNPVKGIPVTTELMQNYPNPFNPSTVLAYTLALRSNVTLTVFNALGQEVAILVHDVQDAGKHEVRFTADGLASGIYFYRLMAGATVATRKLVLIR